MRTFCGTAHAVRIGVRESLTPTSVSRGEERRCLGVVDGFVQLTSKVHSSQSKRQDRK